MKHQTDSRQPTIGPLSFETLKLHKIEGRTLSYSLNHLSYPEGTTVVDAGHRFRRDCFGKTDEQMQVISDHFENGSVCEFMRLLTQGRDSFILRLTGNYDVISTQGGGWLLHNRDDE